MRKSLKQSLLITLTGASLACLGALPLAAATAPAVTQSAQPGAQTLEQRADALLARMTLAEKVGQLSQIGPNSLGAGYEPETLIRKGLVGSVLWTIDTDLINKYQKMAVEETRLGIPILFGFDVIHGYKTTFPVPLAMASSWDPELVRRASQVAAAESLASGINWTFTPMVDIARDARWGRMVEGAGEDPYLGRAMARAQVLGFQGPSLGAPGGILCSVKHFAGYGAADGGRDYDSCYLSEVELQNVYLPPFQAAIDAGCGAVMSAYMTLNDVPATGNAHMLREVLRHQMGFKGFVISDSYSVLALTGHGYSSDEADAARKALTAGVNMDMGSETYIRNVEALVQSGKLDPRVVDEMVREVLLVKLRMGLFERPYGNTADKAKILGDPAHRALAREAACKSMVLLRNEGALLPLSNGLKRIAVIGPLADSREDIKGPWTAENDVAVSVSTACASPCRACSSTTPSGATCSAPTRCLGRRARVSRPPPSWTRRRCRPNRRRPLRPRRRRSWSSWSSASVPTCAARRRRAPRSRSTATSRRCSKRSSRRASPWSSCCSTGVRSTSRGPRRMCPRSLRRGSLAPRAATPWRTSSPARRTPAAS